MMKYQTLGERASAVIVEKKSEFIAVAAPVDSEPLALAVLEEIRSQHRTATHNVYAYVLREQNRQRYSDDGEPAKTAGLPVLSVITHAGLADCIIVVTRYFGGTLLGSGGLVRAYTAAAQAVLAQTTILTMQLCLTLSLSIDYSRLESARRIFSEAGARLHEPQYTERVLLSATLPAGQELNLIPQLNELCRQEAELTISAPFFTPFG